MVFCKLISLEVEKNDRKCSHIKSTLINEFKGGKMVGKITGKKE